MNKKNKKFLIAKENKCKWDNSDSKSSSLAISSGESKDDERNCFMADVEPKDTNIKLKTTDYMIIDFCLDEFTHEDLTNTLYDMLDEYIRLSKSLKDVKVENNNETEKLQI